VEPGAGLLMMLCFLFHVPLGSNKGKFSSLVGGNTSLQNKLEVKRRKRQIVQFNGNNNGSTPTNYCSHNQADKKSVQYDIGHKIVSCHSIASFIRLLILHLRRLF